MKRYNAWKRIARDTYINHVRELEFSPSIVYLIFFFYIIITILLTKLFFSRTIKKTKKKIKEEDKKINSLLEQNAQLIAKNKQLEEIYDKNNVSIIYIEN